MPVDARRAWPAVVVLVALVAAVVASPIIRGPEFHVYADERGWLGVPYAGDVLSNLPFILVGALGLVRRGPHLVFLGFVLIGLGSGAYHYAPSDATLAFDWLPIVLTLGWLSAALIADRLAPDRFAPIAILATAVAIASVAAWWGGGGTSSAPGDMRWYITTQATGVVLIGLTALAPPLAGALAALSRNWVLAGVAAFLVARGLSRYDRDLLDAISVSGHTLKHLVLGVACYCIYRAMPATPAPTDARPARPPRRPPSS
jgi:hypothetical protein